MSNFKKRLKIQFQDIKTCDFQVMKKNLSYRTHLKMADGLSRRKMKKYVTNFQATRGFFYDFGGYFC